MSTQLTAVPGGYALQTPFHRELVDAIKALPFHQRRWDGGRRAWILDPAIAGSAVQLVRQHLGISLEVPIAVASEPELRVVKMEYLGRCKERHDGSSSATGWADGSWSLIFPEDVLRTWFLGAPDVGRDTSKPPTLYQLLTVKPDAPAEDVKRAYRRLVMQLHPDRNREPDASEQFQAVQRAWEILRDDKTRRKYDAGLALERSLTAPRPKNFLVNRHDDEVFGYRSPLRCGLLLVEGIARVGQLVISKILDWQDIRRDDGRVMVSSWPAGAETFHVEWCVA